MKWLPATGAVQYDTTKRYCVVHATETNWIAYALRPTTGDQLGCKPTDEEARQVCEDHEALLSSMQRRA